MLFDSLASHYHWSHEQMISLTLPQIIMYNYGAWANNENMERRMEARRKLDEKKRKEDEENPVVMNGKRVDELSGDQMMSYLGDL